MEPGTEFYAIGTDGKEHAFVVASNHPYISGNAITFKHRDPAGKTVRLFQMMQAEVDMQLDELCGLWSREPSAEQIKLKGK